MKFEKGKTVRMTKSFYESIPEGTILSMDDVSLCKSSFLCYDYPNEFVWFSDCEEIEEDKSYIHFDKETIDGIRDRFLKNAHYSTRTVNGLDVIDLVKHWNLNFNEGNILKYLLRDKGQDKQDLEKIIDYAQRELKHLNNEEV